MNTRRIACGTLTVALVLLTPGAPLVGQLVGIDRGGRAHAELRRLPRVIGLRLGMPLGRAMVRLKALGAEDVTRRDKEESFVPGKKFKAVEVRARFSSTAKKLPRRLKLFFYRERMIGLRVYYRAPTTDFDRVGKADVQSADGKRKIWVDLKRLRFAGCRRSYERCEAIDLSYLVAGSKGRLTRVEAHDLLAKVRDKERQRAARSSTSVKPRPRPVPTEPAGTGESPVTP